MACRKTRYVAQRNARLYAADPRQCPYLLNHALQDLLRGHGHAAGDIIHFTDYVVERGSDKHIAYAASKAALDNMTRSFARKLAPEVKVNAIAPAMILFNEGDDAEYRQQALNKSLMKIAHWRERGDRPYRLSAHQLLRHRQNLCRGRRATAALVKAAPEENQHPALSPNRPPPRPAPGKPQKAREIPQGQQVEKVRDD